MICHPFRFAQGVVRLASHRFIFLLLLSLILTLASPAAIAQIPVKLNQPTAGTALVQQAEALYHTGQFQAAVTQLQQAVRTFADSNQPLNQAIALGNLANTLAALGDWSGAQTAIDQSLTLVQSQAKTPEQQQLLARTYDLQGKLALETGNSQQALDYWQQASRLYQGLQNQSLQTPDCRGGGTSGAAASQTICLNSPLHDQQRQNQFNQSLALQTLGLYPRACQTLLTALGIEHPTCQLTDTDLQHLRQTPVSPLGVKGETLLGNVLRVLGQLEVSQQLLTLGLEQAQTLQAPQTQAAVSLNLANTLRSSAHQPGLAPTAKQLRLEQASNYYQQAVQLATQPDTRLQAHLNQLSLWLDMGKPEQTATQWQPLLTQIQQQPPSRTAIDARINLAQTLLHLRQQQPTLPGGPNWTTIATLLSPAVTQAQYLGNTRIQAYALANLGKLYEEQQQWAKAETLTQQALQLAPPYQVPDIAYQLFWQLGRLRHAQGDIASAIGHYTQAVNTLATLRGDLVAVSPDVQFSFRESVEPIYRQLVDLLLQGEAIAQDNLKEARRVLELLQVAELDNFFRDACLTTQPVQIDAIDPQAAVIYPVILPDRLEVIAALPHQPLQHYATHLPQAQIERTLRDARSSLIDSFANDRRALRTLYDWLIRPIAADLTTRGVTTLVIVPDSLLRNVPLAALYDGESYLVEHYSTAFTPGLQLLGSRPLAQQSLAALMGGLTQARQGFSPLPSVVGELEQIQNTLTSAVPLVNDTFTTANLQNSVATLPLPIVHLATHGQFSSNAENTFILTWDDRINARKLKDLLQSPDRERAIELLVLSACETARGDDRAALGLAGVAVRAGARSTLASLWLVNDASTSQLMAQFYQELATAKVSKAEALRRAQFSLLQGEYPAPYYWSAFVMVGNWQ